MEIANWIAANRRGHYSSASDSSFTVPKAPQPGREYGIVKGNQIDQVKVALKAIQECQSQYQRNGIAKKHPRAGGILAAVVEEPDQRC
jgi:hypothetical protein